MARNRERKKVKVQGKGSLKRALLLLILILLIPFLSLTLSSLVENNRKLQRTQADLQKRYHQTLKEIYQLEMKRDRLRFLLRASEKLGFKEDYLMEFHLLIPKGGKVVIPIYEPEPLSEEAKVKNKKN